MRVSQNKRIRLEIAQAAAKLLYDEGYNDFLEAKKKAAARLGIHDNHLLPGNAEIETALSQYQSLYHGHEHECNLRSMRESALKAMQLLKKYHPYLSGSVLSGNAGKHSEILIHAYSDAPELIGLLLENRNIPTTICERRIHTSDNTAYFTAYKFIAGEYPIVVIVMPENMIKKPPVDNAEKKPVKRAKISQLQSLLFDSNQTI